MELRATKIEAPGQEDGQALPVVHFIGTSRSMHESWDPNANSNIRGKTFLVENDLLPVSMANVSWETRDSEINAGR